MDLLALLRKEAISVRRNLGLFVVLLVVLPATLTAGTIVYQQTIPQDVPIGVTAAEETTTEDEITLTRAGVTFFATPVSYDTPAEATRALQREEVYLVVRVPPDIMNEDADVTFTVVSDRTTVPFQDPANLTASILDYQLDNALPSDVSVEHERVGSTRELSEYLIPSALFVFVVLYALVYLPYQLRTERLVLDRLRTESRLDLVAASKLLFYGGILVVPAATVLVVTRLLEYDVAALAPGTVLVFVLTFGYLAAIGMATVFFLRFRQTALVVNLGFVLGIVLLSGIAYPVGFFSTTRKMIARSLPTHYSMITARSTMLRDVPLSLYGDYVGILVATTAISLVALKLSIVVYERSQ